MDPEHKYAKTEWERRFLLDHFPSEASVTRIRRISDRYIEGTTLRLRQQSEGEDQIVFKLTQKLSGRRALGPQGLITTIYLTKDEYQVLASLPAKTLTKTRHSVPPFGIDVFEGVLTGLVLAEAEFNSEAEASTLTAPSFAIKEVSDDSRFTGGRLVTVSSDELADWLAEHGVKVSRS
jgi:CYTH domain-containing protein